MVDLGLTDLEADLYLLLLRQAPLSGYGAAKILGKSVPNIYNTLSSMAQKGLVMSHMDRNTSVYVPTPPEEVLSQFERRSSSMIKRAGKAFQSIDCSDSPPAQSVYNLENTSQVLSRSVALIENAETSLSLTSDRYPLLHLSAFLAEAAGRGVNVLVNTYSPVDIPGCDSVCWERRAEREKLPGDLMMMAVDGREMISAYFTREHRVISAFWINNPYIVTVLHHGRSADTILARILNMLKEDITIEEFRSTVLEMTRKHIYTIPHKSLFQTMTEESYMEDQPDL